MIPVPCKGVYEIATVRNVKSIVVDAYDGGKFMMRHKSIEIFFKHKETGDRCYFRITGKGICYQKAYLDKERKIDFAECKSEFNRLLGDEGPLIFKICHWRMHA